MLAKSRSGRRRPAIRMQHEEPAEVRAETHRLDGVIGEVPEVEDVREHDRPARLEPVEEPCTA